MFRGKTWHHPLWLPGVSFSRFKSPLLSLVFQQEERQCIPQPAQGKRLNKFTQLYSHCSLIYSAFFPLYPIGYQIWADNMQSNRVSLIGCCCCCCCCCVPCRFLVVGERWTRWRRSWRRSWSSALRTRGATHGTTDRWLERCAMGHTTDCIYTERERSGFTALDCIAQFLPTKQLNLYIDYANIWARMQTSVVPDT